ncbi:MAG: transcription termination factor Rho [Actinomycetota bacterium]|nr:transcription termination factor Rho [Actinomycetota bacterium]
MATVANTDRSLLEKKRNDELILILNSLGVPLPTRPRKAELVDLIIGKFDASKGGGDGATLTAISSDGSANAEQESRGGRGGRRRRGSESPNATDTVENLPLFSNATETASKVGSASAEDQPSRGNASNRGNTDSQSDEASNDKRLIRSKRQVRSDDEGSESAPAWNGEISQVKFEPVAILPPIVVEVETKEVQAPRSAPVEEVKVEQVERTSSVETAPETRREGQSQSGDRNEARHESDRDNSDQNSRRRDKRRNQRDGRRDPREGPSDTRQAEVSNAELVDFGGLFDLRDEGFGFIRANGFLPSPKDVYVSANLVRKFQLRKGDIVQGGARTAMGSEKYAAVVRIDQINTLEPEAAKARPRFEELTPLFPDEKLQLESKSDPANTTARIIDLVSPIGKGQRGLIVSPPKAGKTTILKDIAHCIEANNPEVYLMVLLVDERPEEVTDIKRSVRGEVVASTFDRPSEEHVAVVELAIEKAKRMVEMGRDVVIMLDGITRLTRAYNLALPATGRIMSGGVDSGAIYPPKKFFGAARNVEEGGSLTILATALVETGSRMDEVIFEEFKGTGNMELRLDRKLAERRLYPAIDVISSSTRHEELLFQRDQLNQVWKLRRVLNALAQEGSSAPGLELLIDKIKSTKSNADFLMEIAKSPGL